VSSLLLHPLLRAIKPGTATIPAQRTDQHRADAHLERNHKLALLLARQVHVAKLAPPQGPANVKV
jgi:hypothetical protein